MKTLIITAALLLTGLFASAQNAPYLQHKVIKVVKIVDVYDVQPNAARVKMQDSLKALGFTPTNFVRIAGTSKAKVTFVKVIR